MTFYESYEYYTYLKLLQILHLFTKSCIAPSYHHEETRTQHNEVKQLFLKGRIQTFSI